MVVPGPTRFGFMRPSPVGPRLLPLLRSPTLWYPLSNTLPTVRAFFATPGVQIVWLPGPLLPLQTTYVCRLVQTLSSSLLESESVPFWPNPVAPPLTLTTSGAAVPHSEAFDMKSMPLSIHEFRPVLVLPQILPTRMCCVLPTPVATPR